MWPVSAKLACQRTGGFLDAVLDAQLWTGVYRAVIARPSLGTRAVRLRGRLRHDPFPEVIALCVPFRAREAVRRTIYMPQTSTPCSRSHPTPSMQARDGRLRRFVPVAVHPGEGLLTERTADVRACRYELVLMPHCAIAKTKPQRLSTRPDHD